MLKYLLRKLTRRLPGFWFFYNLTHEDKTFLATVYFKSGSRITARFSKLKFTTRGDEFTNIEWDTLGDTLLHTMTISQVEAIVRHA